MLKDYSQSGGKKAVAYSAVSYGSYSQTFPNVHHGLQVFPPKARAVASASCVSFSSDFMPTCL